MKEKSKPLCGALCLALLLTACGGAGTPAPSETPAPSGTRTPSETSDPGPADTAPGAEPAGLEEEVTIAGGDEAEALEGAIIGPGMVLNSAECAIMLSYELETDDVDAAAEKIGVWAEANGYVPAIQSGGGSHIYAVVPWGDGGGVSAVVLGEEGAFQLGVEAGKQGQARRFAQKNILWTVEDVTRWEVLYLDEQDYSRRS